MMIKLVNDGLGIDTDYRVLLKDFSELYTKFDSVNLESILNKNLNEVFWHKLIDNWLNNHSVVKVNESIQANKIPNFNEKLDIDWLNLAQRDYNYQWRLHSFDFYPALLSAYQQTKDKKYLDIVMNLLIKWEDKFIREYHFDEIFAWNDHSTANRLLNLTYCLFFLIYNTGEEKALNLIKNIILIHIVVLSCRNFYSYHTNHGMFQASHTYTASTLLKYEIDGVNFQEINFNRLKEEFDFSFTKEFVHKENSPDYHLVIFKNFLQFNSNLKQLESTPKEFIPDVNNFVAGSLKFLAYAIKPNGVLPIIGDTEEKQIDNLSHLSNQHNYTEFLYAQSKGKQGKPLNKIGCAFEESGYFFIKTNYPDIPHGEQFYLAAKSGFLSKYHRQDDDCHFVLSAYGEDWLIDGGLYRHEHHDPIREYMRSRYSHNLLMPKDNVYIERQTPPNREEQEKLGLTNWLNTGSIIRAELSTNMFSGFEYKRRFNYYDSYKLKIVDEIKNISSSDNTDVFQLVYHFPNDKDISIDRENNFIKIESKTSVMNLKVAVADDIDISILNKDFLPNEFIQKTSSTYNQLDDCQTILFEFKGVSKQLKELLVETNIEIKKKYDALRVFVLGSCVTRDSFELPEARQFKLVNYFARTSFASAFQEKSICGYDLSNIKSDFQRRMVENDLHKKTTEYLKSTEFDYLIIDLIDERFGIAMDSNGGLFTLSSEFKDNIVINDGLEIIDAGEDLFFEYWCKGWNDFIDIAKEHNFLHKIILNKVYWANVLDENNTPAFPDYVGWINRNNSWLDRLYSYIEQDGRINIISYSHNDFIVDKEHRWGIQPYHYTKSFYLKFLSKLEARK